MGELSLYPAEHVKADGPYPSKHFILLLCTFNLETKFIKNVKHLMPISEIITEQHHVASLDRIPDIAILILAKACVITRHY